MTVRLMNMEYLVEWELAGETEVPRGNLSQCHFVHNKSHISWRGIELGHRGVKPATKYLSYGTTGKLLPLPVLS
jgi:hypothetical protein